jgi:hypothetical protein
VENLTASSFAESSMDNVIKRLESSIVSLMYGFLSRDRTLMTKLRNAETRDIMVEKILKVLSFETFKSTFDTAMTAVYEKFESEENFYENFVKEYLLDVTSRVRGGKKKGRASLSSPTKKRKPQDDSDDDDDDDYEETSSPRKKGRPSIGGIDYGDKVFIFSESASEWIQVVIQKNASNDPNAISRSCALQHRRNGTLKFEL